MQVKYKAAVKNESSSSLFHLLPETLQTQRVKEVTELQSEVHMFIIHSVIHFYQSTEKHLGENALIRFMQFALSAFSLVLSTKLERFHVKS